MRKKGGYEEGLSGSHLMVSAVRWHGQHKFSCIMGGQRRMKTCYEILHSLFDIRYFHANH